MVVDLKGYRKAEVIIDVIVMDIWLIPCLHAGLISCPQFDSGGPLLWTNPRTGLLYHIGISSYGLYCAGSEPGVSTRVASYLSWIQQNTAGTQFCRPVAWVIVTRWWTRMLEDADFILQFAGIEFNLTGYVIAHRVSASADDVARGCVMYRWLVAALS